jgi:hypothetical protein
MTAEELRQRIEAIVGETSLDWPMCCDGKLSNQPAADVMAMLEAVARVVAEADRATVIEVLSQGDGLSAACRALSWLDYFADARREPFPTLLAHHRSDKLPPLPKELKKHGKWYREARQFHADVVTTGDTSPARGAQAAKLLASPAGQAALAFLKRGPATPKEEDAYVELVEVMGMLEAMGG